MNDYYTVRAFYDRIKDFHISPYTFSPDNDGVLDTTTISATFRMPLQWTITIKNESDVTNPYIHRQLIGYLTGMGRYR